MGNYQGLAFVNFILSVVFYAMAYITAFLMGFGARSNQVDEITKLFVLFYFINLIVMVGVDLLRFRKPSMRLVVIALVISLVWLLFILGNILG